MADLLVLGLGNLLLTDDGLGPAVMSELVRRFAAPEGVSLLDGGTLGLALLGELAEARAAILVDAVAAEAPAGTLVRIEGDDVAPAVAERLSPHQIGVADLLGAARLLGREPPTLVLLGAVAPVAGAGRRLHAAGGRVHRSAGRLRGRRVLRARISAGAAAGEPSGARRGAPSGLCPRGCPLK